jgi:HlyD family secretion protein
MPDQLTVSDPASPSARAPTNPRAVLGRNTSRRGRWLGLGGAILLLMGAAIWWSYDAGTAIRYVTQPAARGSVSRTVTATGTVNPVLTIIVGSYVSGVIQQVSCDYNTKVTQGQVCAKIDPRPYQTVVDQDKASLATAQAQLDKDRASLAYAKITAQRYGRLVKQDSASKDAADNAQSAYAQAEAQIELDEATVALREAALEAAQVNLGYTNITSPVDGTVVSRNVTMGQTVAASFQTPTLFLIATDLTKMQVDINVSESDIGTVHEGNPASFTVEAFPARAFAGTVKQIRQAPQTVQNVVTYDVVVSVDNNDLALKPGMTATAKIVTAQRNDVLRIPDQALRYRPSAAPRQTGAAGSGARVWVMRDGEPTAVPLSLGLDDDTYSEVLSGDLKPDDAVIIAERNTIQSTGAARPRLFGF